MEQVCSFCGMDTLVRMHHLIPRCKNGIKTTPTCFLCENWIHNQWSHNELRDTYNSVEAILNSEKCQSFLKWRRRQPATVVFKSDRGKFRSKTP